MSTAERYRYGRGYYRVSTDHQGMNGNGMAAQRKAVEDYLNGGRWKLVGEFTEVESGKRSDRPELEKFIVSILLALLFSLFHKLGLRRH